MYTVLSSCVVTGNGNAPLTEIRKTVVSITSVGNVCLLDTTTVDDPNLLFEIPGFVYNNMSNLTLKTRVQ